MLPAVTNEGALVVRPARAIDYRQLKQSGRFCSEVLIEWEDLPTEKATWENMQEIKDRFPNFILEDKEVREEGGNDRSKGKELKNAYNRMRRAQIKAAAQSKNVASSQQMGQRVADGDQE